MHKFFKHKETGITLMKREGINNGVLLSEFNPSDLIPWNNKTFVSFESIQDDWDEVKVYPEGDPNKEVEALVLDFMKGFIAECFDHGITEDDQENFNELRSEKFIEAMLENKRFNAFEDLLSDFASTNYPEDFADDIKSSDHQLLGVLWYKRQDLQTLILKLSEVKRDDSDAV